MELPAVSICLRFLVLLFICQDQPPALRIALPCLALMMPLETDS